MMDSKKRIYTNKVRGKYLEISEGEDGVVIKAFDGYGKIEEIITERTIKNFKIKNYFK